MGENGAWLFAFVQGVLQLRIEVRLPAGALFVHGVEVPLSGQPTKVLLAEADAAALPPEVDTLEVDGLNVFGRRVKLVCQFGQDALQCSASVTDNGTRRTAYLSGNEVASSGQETVLLV